MAQLLELVGPRAGTAPLTYTVSELGTFDVQTVRAVFNGAAASGEFRPCLTVRAQDGTILARVFPGDTVAAGDSAEVTFAPFLGRGDSSGDDPATEILTGWISDRQNTWTRTSNTTFTTSTDRTLIFAPGTRIRWKDGGAFKYAVVISSSFAAGTTTVTFTAGTDYVMSAATITENDFSYATNPQGYPGVFNYTPTLTAAPTSPTLGTGSNIAGVFAIVGKIIFCRIAINFGTSGVAAGSGNYIVSFPVVLSGGWPGAIWLFDNSSGVARIGALRSDGLMWVDSANVPVSNANPWTWAALDQLQIVVTNNY